MVLVVIHPFYKENPPHAVALGGGGPFFCRVVIGLFTTCYNYLIVKNIKWMPIHTDDINIYYLDVTLLSNNEEECS